MMVEALSAASVPDTSVRHLSLWNTEAFYDLNPEASGRRVQIDHHNSDGRLVGSFVGARVDDRLVSGFSAPFGGIDFTRPDEIPRHVVDMVRATFEHAASIGVDLVELRMKPTHHGAAESHLLFVMLTIGAEVSLASLNYYLDLSPSAGLPLQTLRPRAEKAARRCADLGWGVELLDPVDEGAWAEAYTVLERNRVEKGRPIRLSLDYVRRIRDRFSPLVRMRVVRDRNGAIRAAALVYRCAEGHDVVQYWGDLPGEPTSSPMPLLAREVFAASLATGARFVDLGIASDAGRPNHGLIQFKRSVGALTEVRLDLSARVADVLASPAWGRLSG